MKYLDNCVKIISEEELHKSRDEELHTHMLGYILLGWHLNFWALSRFSRLQSNKMNCQIEQKSLHFLTLKKNKVRISFINMLSPPPSLKPSVSRRKQLITSDMGIQKSYYCHLSAHWVTRIKGESCKRVDRQPLKGQATSKCHAHLRYF